MSLLFSLGGVRRFFLRCVASQPSAAFCATRRHIGSQSRKAQVLTVGRSDYAASSGLARDQPKTVLLRSSYVMSRRLPLQADREFDESPELAGRLLSFEFFDPLFDRLLVETPIRA
jgi:hypothetical protein